MIRFYEKKKLISTFDEGRVNVIKERLKKNNIECQIHGISLDKKGYIYMGTGLASGPTDKMDVPSSGNLKDSYEYTIYVKRSDYAKAIKLI